MLIEQIIEFELRGPGSPRRTCIPKPGYFYDKTKISKANLPVNCYILKNIAGGNVPCFLPSGQSH